MTAPVEAHVCDSPFWRTPDSRWVCPDCGEAWVWRSYIRTVPGVPASVCTVRENRWEREEESTVDPNEIPGWEGSVGPGPSQYNKPHVYARSVHSGAGNCVCGSPPRDKRLHVQLAPGVPNPDYEGEIP